MYRSKRSQESHRNDRFHEFEGRGDHASCPAFPACQRRAVRWQGDFPRLDIFALSADTGGVMLLQGSATSAFAAADR
jgi:hypothetical protein